MGLILKMFITNRGKGFLGIGTDIGHRHLCHPPEIKVLKFKFIEGPFR